MRRPGRPASPTRQGARDQLANVKRRLGNDVRGLPRLFGVRPPPHVGTKKSAESAHHATQNHAAMLTHITVSFGNRA